MNNTMFSIFLRDAPVEISATLEAAGLLDEVDAITCRRIDDEYTAVVRHRGDWFMAKRTCRQPEKEENQQPRMRRIIGEIAEEVVNQIGAVA